MHQYLQLLEDVEKRGFFKGDRTGTGTTSLFGRQFRFSLKNGELPVVTTKKVHLPSVEEELNWMKSGDTRVDYLLSKGVRIWNEWVKPETAVYKPLTTDEIRKAVLKAVGGNYHLTFHADQSRPGLEIHHVNDYVEATGWDLPILDDSADLIVMVNTYSYTVHRESVEHLPQEDQCVAILHHMLIGEPKRLVGGDLGPVYGKTWRNIEDTRIVPKAEQVDYEKRGFTHIVDIPSVSHVGAECVVHRRVDQVKDLLDQLANNPDSRRLIICAWDPRLIEDQALPPCHAFIQFWTRELSLSERLDLWLNDVGPEATKILLGTPISLKHEMFDEWFHGESGLSFPITKIADEEWDKFIVHHEIDLDKYPKRAISCQLYQRSSDCFLGLPFNITFYSLMTHQLANQFNMVAEEFIWTGGDCHIYSNHEEQCKLQRSRNTFPTPSIQFKPEAVGKPFLEITRDDYEIVNYQHHAHIAGKVAV